ncbi:unnamed protein product [Hymenolepis diminuta]|uniref:Integrase zinc-binding domain-containing protein n=1 Tax=Hymenolepis diminuta TaxID=6216 RepID=A0A564YPU7_HYMDI|nr:unnamed protein product [Hymenolepis diminuta]
MDSVAVIGEIRGPTESVKVCQIQMAFIPTKGRSPRTLRNKVLRQFHSGHPGVSQMKSIARGYAYWPGMDKDIEYLVRQCDKCQQAAKNTIRQDAVLWLQTETSWIRLHVDFVGPSNGQTERLVDTLRRGLQKAKARGLWEGYCRISTWNTDEAPLSALVEKSPTGVLMGRGVRKVHEGMLSTKTLSDRRESSRKSGVGVSTPIFVGDYQLGRQWAVAIITN